jgi:predicted AlkP superfamily pyrophosphatase or phosphodiesterase
MHHRSARSISALRNRLAVLIVAASAASAAGCAARYVVAPPEDRPAAAQPATAVSRRVIIVSVDGLRPDAIGRFGATTLQRLMAEGSYTLSASTILPSKTLPSHTSMLTGEPPDVHHVLWNNVLTADADSIDVPNVFSVARSHGYSTAAFFSKAKFGPLQRAGTLDYSQAPGGPFGKWTARRTVGDVEKYLASARPDLLFVHLADPDSAGHRSGWMSDDYASAVRSADRAIARLVRAADTAFGAGSYTLIVTADHGGHGNNHGSEDARDVLIPWIAWGRGVKPGSLAGSTVKTMDTAATVLWLMGLSEPADWAGAPVTSAFDGAAADIAAGG